MVCPPSSTVEAGAPAVRRFFGCARRAPRRLPAPMHSSAAVGRWGWALRLLAVSYVALLVVVVLALRLVGERWWVTDIGLYLPRVGFALPLPPIAFAAAVTRRWRLLATQAVAGGLLAFPIMGLHLGFPAPGPSPRAG